MNFVKSSCCFVNPESIGMEDKNLREAIKFETLCPYPDAPTRLTLPFKDFFWFEVIFDEEG